MTGSPSEVDPRHAVHGFRVTWMPGSDQLRGVCHCGADRVGEDPIELWMWLHDHPIGHHAGPDTPPVDDAPGPARALIPMPVGITR